MKNRREFKIENFESEDERKAFYEKLDGLAASGAFESAEVVVKLEIKHDPARTKEAAQTTKK